MTGHPGWVIVEPLDETSAISGKKQVNYKGWLNIEGFTRIDPRLANSDWRFGETFSEPWGTMAESMGLT